jgi:hypothetical protein
MDANSFDWIWTAIGFVPLIILVAAVLEIGRISRRTVEIADRLRRLEGRLDATEPDHNGSNASA